MKLLYATMQFGQGYGQGTERYLSVLGDGMRRRGHETHYLAGDPEQRGPKLALGEVVQREPLVRAYPAYGWMSVRGTSARALATLLNDEPPDLIHLANPAHIGVGLIAAARQMHIPIVVTVMDYWWLCPKHTLRHFEGKICNGQVPWWECVTCCAAEHPRGWMRGLARVPALRATLLPPTLLAGAVMGGLPVGEAWRWIRRQALLRDALNSVDAVIFPSQTGRELLQPHLRDPSCHSIPYGLEARWFAAGTSKGAREQPQADGQRRRDPTDVTIGYAGALAEHKGVHLLLGALTHLGWTRTHVRIAGEGSPRYLEQLRQLAAGLEVEFAGSLPSSEMPAFLSGLDLLIVPSLWPENLPIAVLEAQALGVPVLSSRVGGIAEMLPHPAHAFEPGSADSLAERLAAWCSGAVPSVTARVASADEMVGQTLDVYAQVTAPGRAAEGRNVRPKALVGM
jgi:glycosyltransferase involved in cell wall biosynthesis